jgi:phosphoglycerate dehydrogenase-like enzyme
VVLAPGADLARALAGADGAVVLRPDRLDAAMLDAAPRLRVVATVSSGVDHVDVHALADRGIALVAGAGAPIAVAEWVVWSVLSLRRSLVPMAAAFAAGDLDWRTRLEGFSTRSRELTATTVGIVGLGNIGREVARLLAPFGVTLLGHDPVAPPLAGVEPVDSVLALCERSDVVTIHVPLIDSTSNLLGPAELAALGPDGIVVNAARGGIIDQAALVAALRTGALGGAALDVFDPEPADPALVADLVATGRVLLTPHVAGVSREALATLNRVAVDGLVAHLGIAG